MNTAKKLETLRPPEWTVVEILAPNRAWKNESPVALGTCERCGRELWARLYVLENADGKRYRVGSGCVKTLTGRTLTTIAAERAAYLAECREVEEETEAKSRRAEFHRANAAILEHLDKRAEIEMENNERLLRGYYALPVEERWDVLVFPNLACFWTEFRDRVLRKYSLTPTELRFIKEDMSRGKGALPAIKSRATFRGEVIRFKVWDEGPTYRGRTVASFTVRTQDFDWFIKVTRGSHLWDALGLPWGWADRIPKGCWVGREIACKATVKGHDPAGGRIFLTRGEPA